MHPSNRAYHTTVLCVLYAVVVLTSARGPGPRRERSKEQCVYNNMDTLANCSSQSREHVPWGLHNSIHMLDLSSNYFPTLPSNSFISYQYLRHLYLQNNSINVIRRQAFANLKNLRHLDLSNNKLTSVPSVSLAHMNHSLTNLILSGNKIYTVNKGTFAYLHNLKHLDLSGNSIYQVEYGAFQGLSSMVVFKIHRNALTYLPTDSFDDMPAGTMQVRLYDNRWFCDCRMRWLWAWLNHTDPAVWDTPGYPVQCIGPSIVREKTLNVLSLDELACEVQMRTSSYTTEHDSGANVTLQCKYLSIPSADATWLLNSEIIDTAATPGKYKIESGIDKGVRGETIQVTELTIRDFEYEDIAKYECFVQNIRGDGSTEYRLTLRGVDFDVATSSPSDSQVASAGVDTRSVVIAVAVVCGIILLIGIGVLVFCSVNNIQKRKQEKREATVANIKQHFIKSEEMMSNGELDKSGGGDKLDGTLHDDQRSNSNHTNDSNLTAVKRPLDLDETEPLYIFEQPGSPFINGNTYVSFGSELTEPEDFSPPHASPYPAHHAYGGGGGGHPRYESSHAGSATPLLDRHTPSVFDSDEPTEDYAQYPVYDSLTNSLQHPAPHHSNGGDTSFYSNPGTTRTDSSSGGSTAGGYRGPTPQHNGYHNGGGGGEPAKRMSSFHYPQSASGTAPRGGSTRALGTPNRYNSHNSDYGDLPPPPPPPYYGARTMDYRDNPRYPSTTPPPNRMNAKSMSVGNLGYAPMPASTGPRKPPRLHQSREYMELTPQETSQPQDYTSMHSNSSSDAHNYSQSFGITPGTPV